MTPATPTPHGQFRRCAGKFATGVAVVLSPGAGQPAGMTVNSFTPVSLDPLIVLVSLGHGTRTLAAIARDGRFSINVLHTGHTGLATALAAPGAPFPGSSLSRSQDGHLLVPDALATMTCRLTRLIPVGDHVLVLGAVESHATGGGEHLLFLEGAFLGSGRCAPAS